MVQEIWLRIEINCATITIEGESIIPIKSVERNALKFERSQLLDDILISAIRVMSNLIQHHERLYQFIKHKERVLKAKPIVESRPRSKSMPGHLKMSLQKRNEEKRIQEENERLLKSLLKISERKPKYL